MECANRIAPEHITVDEADLSMIRNAGSVFIGDYSPQAAGDYASGPNHVLPTGAAARFRGGLSVQDFLKTISLQQILYAQPPPKPTSRPSRISSRPSPLTLFP